MTPIEEIAIKKQIEDLLEQNKKLREDIHILVRLNEKGFSYSEIAKEIKNYHNLESPERQREADEIIKFYGDPHSQIPPMYQDTGRPQADFTSPYRLDKGKRAERYLWKYKIDV